MKTLLRALAAFALLTTSSFAQVPGIINYQGRVMVNGTNFTGTGQFKFALVDGGTNLSRQATAIAHRTGQFVTSVDVTDGGAGYVSAPGVAFSGGGGSGAAAHSLIGGGVVTSIVVDAAGTGYTSDPSVVIAAPPANMSYRTFWSNGTSAVSVPVTKGLYSVLLGDTSLTNMEAAVPAAVFTNTDVRLRVWFSDGVSGFQQLNPDQRIGAVGYALMAASVPGTGIIGGITVGATADASPTAGTIRWTGTDFQGYDGSQWHSLIAPAPAGMVLVPGGTFTMGWAGLATNEHQVTLSSFYLARHEATYALWHAVRQWALANGYHFENAGREGNDGTDGAAPTPAASSEPVTRVSWRDVIVWCNARTEKEGLAPVYTYTNAVVRDSRYGNRTACDNAVFNAGNNGYRLPTEAEWEYAARYVDGYSWTPGDYPSGAAFNYSNAPACDAVAWYGDNSSNKTHTVGTKKPNQLGISDMTGNVREWCWDWYAAYSSAAVTNPVGPTSGSYRIERGGSWNTSPQGLPCARRSWIFPDHRIYSKGFRCARNAQ